MCPCGQLAANLEYGEDRVLLVDVAYIAVPLFLAVYYRMKTNVSFVVKVV